jgi:Meckel syndrome type 1 protein
VFVSHLAPRDAVAVERDLASVELWEKSLERSVRRRELAERQRRQAPKTKGTAAVMSAALFVSPMLSMISAAGAHNGAAAAGETSPGQGDRAVVPTLLREGDTGPMVAAVQRKLAVDADGIFGPITRQAVLDFQGRTGLTRTGEVDAKTWQALFRASVSYVADDSVIAERIVGEEAGSAPTLRVVALPRVSLPSPDGASGGVAPDEPASERGADSPSDEPDGTPVSIAPPPAEPPAVEQPLVERPASTPVPAPAPAAGCGTLTSPVEGTVTGSFGENRGDHRHAGQDIAAPSGTPVRAVDCGTVTQAASERGYGNIICIQHSASISTCYAHLSSFETQRGDYVEVGQIIGRVGTTGNSTGPHLHFEVRQNGKAVDPEPYLTGGAQASGASTVEASVGSVSSSVATRTQISSSGSMAATGGSVRQGRGTKAALSAEAQSQRAHLQTQPAPAGQVQAAPAAAPQGAATPDTPVAAAPEAPAAPVAEPEVAPTVTGPAAVSETPLATAPPAAEAPAAPAPAAPVAETPPGPAPAPAAPAPAPAAAPPAEAPVAEAPADPVAEAPAAKTPAASATATPTPAPAAPVAEAPAPAPAETAPEVKAGGVGAPVAPVG